MLLGSRIFQFSTWTLIVVMFVGIPAGTLAQANVGTEIPAGTAIRVKFPQTYMGKNLASGETLHLINDEAVLIDGREVIAAGAIVIAEVMSVKKPGAVGKAGELVIAFRFVQGVDGSRIPISGTESQEGKDNTVMSLVCTLLSCILGLIMKGGDAMIPMGTTVTAYTMADAFVEFQ